MIVQSVQAYPLTWPDGLPRTERKAASQFKTGLAGALKNVRGSLEHFGKDSGKPVTGDASALRTCVARSVGLMRRSRG